MSSSRADLILGIDYDGLIVQHDRNAAKILARKPEDLLGAQLIELTSAGPHGNDAEPNSAHANSYAARSADSAAAVAGLLEAIRSDREGSAMLTIDTRDGPPTEAVVTVHPIRAAAPAWPRSPCCASLHRSEGGSVDPAVMRSRCSTTRSPGSATRSTLTQVASELLDALVPAFGNAAGLLLLESLAGDGRIARRTGRKDRRRCAGSRCCMKRKDPAWEAAFPTGEILRYPVHSPYYKCMDTAAPVLETTISKSQASQIAKAWRRKPVAKLLSETSMLLLPLIAQRHHAGLLRLHPAGGVPAVRRVRHRDRHGLRRPAPPSSSTTPGATAGSTPPR